MTWCVANMQQRRFPGVREPELDRGPFGEARPPESGNEIGPVVVEVTQLLNSSPVWMPQSSGRPRDSLVLCSN